MKKILTEYLDAVERERIAKAERVRLAAEIVETLHTKYEGQETHTQDGYKITTKRAVNRKCNWVAFEDIARAHPSAHVPMTMKPALDKAGLEWTKENEPEYYRELMAHAITETPGAASVVIKEVEG